MTERMTRAWERFERAVPKLGVEGAGLVPGVSEAEVQGFEAETGLVLPPELRAYWRGRNGEDPRYEGLVSFRLLSLAEVKRELEGWASVRESLDSELASLNREQSSHPSGAIQRQYSTPGWLPLLSDDEGNHIGVDLNPGPAGTVGQVINFGRDEEQKYVLFPSVVELVEWLAEAIETGRLAHDEDEEGIACAAGERLVSVMQSQLPPRDPAADARPTSAPPLRASSDQGMPSAERLGNEPRDRQQNPPPTDHRKPAARVTELPQGAARQLDDIRAKLLECLAAGAPDHTEARSEFMRYGASEGGQVLCAEPGIAHPDHVITMMYSAMFDQAKQEGVKLREIATSFRRTPNGPWAFESRWVTVPEFNAFTKSVKPIVEELRVLLRAVGSAQRADWAHVSFEMEQDKERVLVLSRDRDRAVLEPSAELRKLAARVQATAEARDLQFIGAGWSVKSHWDDAEGEIESSIHVI